MAMLTKKFILVLLAVTFYLGQGNTLLPSVSAATPADLPDKLVLTQTEIATLYRSVEVKLRRMMEFYRRTKPARYRLLKDVLAKAAEREISTDLEEIIKLLTDRKLSQALSTEKRAEKNLLFLLEILRQEAAGLKKSELEKRLKIIRQDLIKIMNRQIEVQSRTRNGNSAKRTAKAQNKVANRTEKLAKKIRKEEDGDGKGKDGKGKDGKGKDGKGKDGKGKDGKGKDGKGKDGKGKDGKGKDGKGKDGKGKDGKGKDGKGKDGKGKDGKGKDGKGKDGKGKDGKGKDGKGNGQQQQQDSEITQVRKHVEQARKNMEKARKKLEEAKRNESLEEQEKAREELAKAKELLEKILRQLREEQIEQVLEELESRLTRMKEAQIRIYQATKSLHKVSTTLKEDSGETGIKANRLSLDERKIVRLAGSTLLLLKEEGSSIAFPQEMEQVKQDMEEVTERLAQIKIGTITQGIQQDIIEALSDMLAAVKQAQKDQEQRKQNQQNQKPKPGQPTDPSLIDMLAELKMIRAMQHRVNRRTARYQKMLDTPNHPVGQATQKDLINSLVKLAKRQQKLNGIVRDLHQGKNK